MTFKKAVKSKMETAVCVFVFALEKVGKRVGGCSDSRCFLVNLLPVKVNRRRGVCVFHPRPMFCFAPPRKCGLKSDQSASDRSCGRANRGLPSLRLSAIGQPGQTGATHSALLRGRGTAGVHAAMWTRRRCSEKLP